MRRSSILLQTAIIVSIGSWAGLLLFLLYLTIDGGPEVTVGEGHEAEGQLVVSHQSNQPGDDCTLGRTPPAGQANPSEEPEPMGAVWCFPLSPPPAPTRISTANSWIDEFSVNMDMVRFDDGDLGYRIFDNVGAAGGRTQHFLNNNHWMDDNAGGFTGGAMMRPDRSFRFEGNKLVIETDVAASIPAYEGEAWTEVDISLAPAPTGRIVDDLYGYGAFGGYWTFGCRLQPDRSPICALYDDSGRTVFDDGRVWEISFFQQIGDTFGGGPWGESEAYWRECGPNQMDMFCRDRFRLELQSNRFSLYVNGHLYFQQTVAANTTIPGLRKGQMFPDAMLRGDVFVYMTDFQVRPSEPVYRFHWGRLAVNPGTPPSPAPSFCLGRPQNTCPMDIMHK